MKISDIIRLRQQNLLISVQPFKTVAEVVSWLGAMQAQDYSGAKWSVGLRLTSARDRDIENAIAEKSIIRTWPMRGTLHFVAAADARWMLKLLTPRIISSSAGRHRELELDEKVFGKSLDLLVPALEGGRQLMRSEVFQILENEGIATANQRGMHIIGWLAQNQVICHGSHNEKQPTYALMDEWVPRTAELDDDEALRKLAMKYFRSHGPASLKDFVWWTGLKISDAKKAVCIIAGQLETVEVNGTDYYFVPNSFTAKSTDSVYLLPGFDEYMLGYTDRSLILDKAFFPKIIPGNNGMFMPTLVSKGVVEGTWKRAFKKDKVQVEMFPFKPQSESRKNTFEVQSRKFGKFLGKPVDSVTWH